MRYHSAIFKPELQCKKTLSYKQSIHFCQENVEWNSSGKLTVQDFDFQLFGILRVSTLRLCGSPLLLITFYSNLSGRGVSSNPRCWRPWWRWKLEIFCSAKWSFSVKACGAQVKKRASSWTSTFVWSIGNEKRLEFCSPTALLKAIFYRNNKVNMDLGPFIKYVSTFIWHLSPSCQHFETCP